MSRLSRGWLALAALLCSCGGGDSTGGTCTSNDRCRSGYLCNRDGECVPAAPLEIVTSQLETAVEGESYFQTLAGLGGITPYAWSASFSVGWLSIDPVNGEISSAGPVPDDAPAVIDVEVVLRDTSDGGDGMEARRTYRLDVRECREADREYREVDGVCWRGTQACVDGRYGDWTAEERSSDTAHCGPGCGACDPEVADACVEGRCQCGAAGFCVDATCCDGDCVDLMNDVLNCGACGNDCNQELAHAQGKSCEAGACVYEACEDGYYSCDDDAGNGCETEQGILDCSACEDDCTDQGVYAHTSDPACAYDEDLEIDRCHFACQPGYDDCDGDYTTGCEQALSTNDHCGACNHACATDENGHVCVEEEGIYHCGCTGQQDCPAERMCCSGVCVAHNAEHCPDCDTPCTIGTGGLYCEPLDPEGWDCQCVDDDDCRGIYGFSKMQCSGVSQCQCGSADLVCEGTVGDMCCFVGAQLECVDLSTNDDNCGMCGALCAAGESCEQGACTCATSGTCPATSGGPDCVEGECVCGNYSLSPCPVGQYCCDETGNDKPNGCCLRDCTTNISAGNSCSDDCGDPKVWCQSGCCDSCDPDLGCE